MGFLEGRNDYYCLIYADGLYSIIDLSNNGFYYVILSDVLDGSFGRSSLSYYSAICGSYG